MALCLRGFASAETFLLLLKTYSVKIYNLEFLPELGENSLYWFLFKVLSGFSQYDARPSVSTEHASFCNMETQFIILAAFGKFIHGTLRSLLKNTNQKL